MENDENSGSNGLKLDLNLPWKTNSKLDLEEYYTELDTLYNSFCENKNEKSYPIYKVFNRIIEIQNKILQKTKHVEFKEDSDIHCLLYDANQYVKEIYVSIVENQLSIAFNALNFDDLMKLLVKINENFDIKHIPYLKKLHLGSKTMKEEWKMIAINRICELKYPIPNLLQDFIHSIKEDSYFVFHGNYPFYKSIRDISVQLKNEYQITISIPSIVQLYLLYKDYKKIYHK